ncbi:hypothetical protein R1T43_09040 [Alteromonas sp. CI.11.F.A3]|uniref:hypothetical protein n=1 Tax=Alteromonas sp. CI.11.F.A3 TaxID=3079555 RepID=UPI002941F422|nr:hypothetical protein [Alteromonas sp. CI.11.F.A3]WOI39150.1 hypothetical protein R1T43_09040 [Alteromonas sp. CI.11.F.A3]
MNIFLKKNLEDIRQCQHNYLAQKHHAEASLEEAKRDCRLLMGKPEVLLGIIAAGAYKGINTDAPKSKRNQAIMTFVRTTALSFLR